MEDALRNRADARLLFVSRDGSIRREPRANFAMLARAGDLVIANDAATLPASLKGRHVATGREIEVRLAARVWRDGEASAKFQAIVFGEGDFRSTTERRAAPPELTAGDALALGPLNAVVTRILDHPRFIEIELLGTPLTIREGLARHGRPVQYAHVAQPLALWDVWTSIAGPPVAFEAPSAGFILDWAVLARLKARGVHFATLTHAAGLSSTGDRALDARFPLDERYFIAESTASAIADARARGGRIVAIGTSVVRALEHSAAAFDGGVRAGGGVATQRIGAKTSLRVVDAIVTGVHEPGDSHFELLRAFAGASTLDAVRQDALAGGFRGHEFGDWIFMERAADRAA